MNKTHILLIAASVSLLISSIASAQPIQGDPSIVKGTLENGLTYYLRHNGNPEGRADFYIVHNVGALQEEDNQNGLAHFLEHMAFNGTKHYPEKGVINFLEKEGVRFGANINAYTSKTETVYNISSVPLVRETFVDSVLMVLHDWSCDISCEQQAIDDERGVISEEWRRRNTSKTRVFEKQSSIIYNGAKQSQRNVIGTLEVINGFKREEILDFYHKWYRPDMQAIMIVGDFDVPAMEAKIKTQFSDIKLIENAPAKETIVVPAYDGPQVFHFFDPEINYTAFKVFTRAPYPAREVRATEDFYKDWYCRQIISAIMLDRMERAVKEENSKVNRAVFVHNAHGTDFYVSQYTLVVKDESQIEDAMAFYQTMTQRMLRYGISKQEFEVAKLNVFKKMKLNIPQNDNDLRSAVIVKTCVENFLRGMSTATPANLQKAQIKAFNSISYEDAAAYVRKMFDTDQVVYSCSMNDSKKDCVPADEKILSVMDSLSKLPVEPAFMEYKTAALDFEVPSAGKVTKTAEAKGFSGEVWKLSNGAQVYWRPSKTVKANDHLSIFLVFPTGYAKCDQDNINASKFALSFIKKYAGVGGIPKAQLKNDPALLGINNMVTCDRRSATITVSSTAEKAEDAFKFAHLQVTEPYLATDKEVALEKKAMLESLGKPQKGYQKFNEKDKILRYGNDPWSNEMDSTAVEALTSALIKDVFQREYTDFKEMKVFICSDLPKEQIVEYVEKYIATLSSDYKVRSARYRPHVPTYKGKVELVESYPMVVSPKTSVSCDWRLKIKQTPATEVQYDVLDFILSRRYLNVIREERGGTYTISFSSDSYSDAPDVKESNVSFETRPEMRDILVQDVFDIIGKLAAEGPGEDEISDAVKYLSNRRKNTQKRMSEMLPHLNKEVRDYVCYGSIFDFDYEGELDKVTVAQIKKLAAKVAAADRLLNVYSEE